MSLDRLRRRRRFLTFAGSLGVLVLLCGGAGSALGGWTLGGFVLGVLLLAGVAIAASAALGRSLLPRSEPPLLPRGERPRLARGESPPPSGPTESRPPRDASS